MNLRQDKQFDKKPVDFRFKIGDRVILKNKFYGTITYTAIRKDNPLYVIRLDNVYELGIKSTDKDIGLLKPIDISIAEITITDESIMKLSDLPSDPHAYFRILFKTTQQDHTNA